MRHSSEKVTALPKPGFFSNLLQEAIEQGFIAMDGCGSQNPVHHLGLDRFLVLKPTIGERACSCDEPSVLSDVGDQSDQDWAQLARLVAFARARLPAQGARFPTKSLLNEAGEARSFGIRHQVFSDRRGGGHRSGPRIALAG